MGKGAKIALIIIAILIVCCGALALYVVLQPEKTEAALPEETAQAAVQTAEEEPDVQTVEATAAPETAEATATPEADALPEGIYNILFVGADSRTAEEAEVEGLSDSMMVVSYNTNSDTITLISFMRDSCVWRIGQNQQFMGKLNAAFKNGGAQELIDTLNLNFELGIEDYVTVGYEGFSMLIDELGGLDVAVTSEEAYLINWRTAGLGQEDGKTNRAALLQQQGLPVLEEGYEGTKVQHLIGVQALWYARNRTSPSADGQAGSDIVRVNRQQVLMQLIYEKVKTEKTLDTIAALIKFGFQYVKTDMDLSTMIKLGSRILKADKIEFVNVRVPFEGTSRSGNADKGETASGLYFDIDDAAARIHAIIYPEG